MSDNGTCFISAEFEAFLQSNGIMQAFNIGTLPSSIEWACRTCGSNCQEGSEESTIRDRLAKILMAYRFTPQSTTGLSPAELIFKNRPRSRLDLLKPHTAERVESHQQKQKEYHDVKAKNRQFNVGDNVFVCNY